MVYRNEIGILPLAACLLFVFAAPVDRLIPLRETPVQATGGPYEPKVAPTALILAPNSIWRVLLRPIEIVESLGDPRAVGDNGAAIGILQLHKTYVDDVNRIMGYQVYSYADRWDAEYSRAMAAIYLNYYGAEQRLGRPTRFSDLARIHNGGPDGWREPSTEPYWTKVKEALDADR